MRVRLHEDVVRNFAKDIIFIVTTDFYPMEAIEPREEEMKYMRNEVNYDLLIGYANNLLASPVDKKKKRLDTIEEQTAKAKTNSSPTSSGNGKKKKAKKAPLVSTSTRVTPSVQVKKEPTPKVYIKKQPATKKRGRQLILSAESNDTDTEEEPKKVKASGKKAKPVEATSQTISIKALSYKPMSNFERMMTTLGMNRFDKVKECFDSFDED